MKNPIHGPLFLCSIAIVPWGCGTLPSAFELDAGTNPATSETNPNGSTFASDGGLGAALGCANDLRTIVDSATGATIRSCPPDQACAEGQCIRACDAAALMKGTVGCDFVVPTPQFSYDMQACFVAFVANNWIRPVKISAKYGDQPIDLSKFARVPNGLDDPSTWPTVSPMGLDPAQVAVIFLADGMGAKCNVPAAFEATGLKGSARGKAFRITTDLPVSAYDILPFGGARSLLTSAELLLPTSAWGTNYVAMVAPIIEGFRHDTTSGSQGPQWGQIAASEDNTTVRIVPTVSLPGGPGVAAAPANAVTTYTLNKGEFIQWSPRANSSRDFGPSARMEMSGSVIESDKPVGFFGGNAYLCLDSPTSNIGGGCDSSHQQIAPLSALGWEYAAAPYATRLASLRDEAIRYRIVGTVDGTSLKFEPPVTGAPSSLGRGQIAEFVSTHGFVVSSDKAHPFHVAQLMPGGFLVTSEGAVESGRPGSKQGTSWPSLGDEEYVVMLPPAQFLRRYVFFTDPTYGTTNLVLTRVKGSKGFQDVQVDCLGTVGGWKPLGTTGAYETTNVDLSRVTLVGTCKNGFHVAESDGAFGIVVWGLDSFVSYAYPAGGNVGRINEVVISAAPR